MTILDQLITNLDLLKTAIMFKKHSYYMVFETGVRQVTMGLRLATGETHAMTSEGSPF